MTTLRWHFGLGLVALVMSSVVVGGWVRSSSGRLQQAQAEAQALAGQAPAGAIVAAQSDEGYCTPQLKQILKRVLTSCGLVKAGAGRGCQPLEARTVAAMAGDDFNALFHPLAGRAAIIQFEKDEALLDAGGQALLEKAFTDQRGASYFLVVSRASPEGSVKHNAELSEARANAVLEHLKTRFQDPDLESEVGLLWLGEEFAQLEEEFCKWTRSRPETTCTPAELNRSAFIAWIDCRL